MLSLEYGFIWINTVLQGKGQLEIFFIKDGYLILNNCTLLHCPSFWKTWFVDSDPLETLYEHTLIVLIYHIEYFSELSWKHAISMEMSYRKLFGVSFIKTTAMVH